VIANQNLGVDLQSILDFGEEAIALVKLDLSFKSNTISISNVTFGESLNQGCSLILS
jgi:hypothetical protein